MMKYVLGGIAATFLAMSPIAANAQAYPEAGKSVHLIIPYDAGGGTDLNGRMLAEALEKKLGVPFVVENFGGAGGMRGLSRLLDADPDGYTLAFAALPLTNVLYLDKERGATFTAEDFIPIALHDTGALAIAVSASSPWQTLDDVIKAAKERPGELTAASNNLMSTGHFATMQLGEATGTSFNYTIVEQPGMLLSNVMGGHIDLITDTFAELIGPHKAGDLRILAVLSEQRLPDFDDIPTAVEQGVNNVIASSRVLVAPKGTPQEVIDVLSKAVGELAADPEYQKVAASRGAQLDYKDAAGATKVWGDLDSAIRPMIEKIRAMPQ